MNCQYAFESKTINEKGTHFSVVLMNILSNFVPHNLLKFNYKHLPWMNSKMKLAKITKLFYKNPSDSLKELLMTQSTKCSNLFFPAKKKNYHKKMAEKLGNPFTAQKAYWPILNRKQQKSS